MLVYAGIDEAGYGPMLGPLCVGCTVFVLSEDDPADGPPDLWRRLKQAVCRRPGDKRRRVAVDDSKRLKGPRDGAGHPLRHLERAVLAFGPGLEPAPADDGGLFRLLGTDISAQPWFASTSAIPVGQTSQEIRISRGRIDRAMAAAAIRCASISCRALDAGRFNTEVRDSGSKATVNFRLAIELVESVLAAFPGEHVRVLIDRHGGRTRYAETIVEALPGASVETVAETETLSRYRMEHRGRRATVSFAAGGDGRFFPVALASMTAKYVRDLLMMRLNRFFQEHMPELQPTAGYYGDARRYLEQIRPVMRRLRIRPAELVRSV